MKPQTKAYLYAGTAVLMWSTVGSAFKLTLRHLTPLQMLLGASAVSIVVLGIILFILKKQNLLLRTGWKGLVHSALLGLMNPLLFYIVLFSAYDLLLTQEAMVLNFTWPVTLTILSFFLLRQRIGWKSFLAIFISFIGIVIIGTGGKVLTLRFSNPAGVTLALISTVIWSLFWIYNIKDSRDEVVKLFLNFLFGFIYIFIVSAIINLETFHIPGYLSMLEPGKGIWPFSMEALYGCLYIGIFEMGIAYVFWLKGLQLSKTTAKVSNLIFFAPFISLLIINLTVGEPLKPATLAGLAFIITGVIIQRR
jgi:drug/metabolite transporter (DMT)-like permease